MWMQMQMQGSSGSGRDSGDLAISGDAMHADDRQHSTLLLIPELCTTIFLVLGWNYARYVWARMNRDGVKPTWA